MQELRSTDILDKEILFESRKKVEKILKNADAECQELFESLDGKIQIAKSEKQKFYDNKLKIFEKNKKVSIPLEKQRFKITFIENSLLNSINEYLKSVDDEKKIKMLLSHLKCDFDFLCKQKLNAFVYGFNLNDAKIQLNEKLGKYLAKCEVTDFGKIVPEDKIELEKPQGIILESEDKNFRCRLTFSEILEEILDKNRAELTSALFGGDL